MTDISKYEFETRDELDRKPIAEKISTLVSSDRARDFFPILIDGDWGAGKTEFLFKLKNYLMSSGESQKESTENADNKAIQQSKENFYVSYINAFSSDYYHDPFMVIVREVYDLLGQGGSRKDLRALFSIIKKAAPDLVGIAANIGISFLPGATTIKQTMNAMAKVSKAMDKAQELAYEKQLNEFLVSVNSLSDFKTILQNTIEKIGGKYILIIDELDRCRPDYAVKLLEMAKHLFDVAGLYIVYGANSKYLEANIRKTYIADDVSKGRDLSENYLAKFFNLRFILTARSEAKLFTVKDLDANWSYFKNIFLDSNDGVGGGFVEGFNLLEEGGHSRFDTIFKRSISAFLGDKELRERERFYKSILFVQMLGGDVSLSGFIDSWEDIPFNNPCSVVVGSIGMMLGVSLYLDKENELINDILQADIFFTPTKDGYAKNIDIRDNQKGVYIVEIEGYLKGKNLLGADLEYLYPYLFHDSDDFLDHGYIFSDAVDNAEVRNRFYGLRVLRETLRIMKGVQLK